MFSVSKFASFLNEEQPSGVLTASQTRLLKKAITGEWSINPATGLIDVEGNVEFHDPKMGSLMGLTFGKVTGDFWCPDCGLESLEGSPQDVGGIFCCSNNPLKSLKGGPQKVSKAFDCSNCELQSLEGSPSRVGNFNCSHNQLRSLSGSPSRVDGKFECGSNLLISLEGGPTRVDWHYNCEGNPELRSLKGAPKFLNGDFICRDCKSLKSLEGAPQSVKSFVCNNCSLTDLIGCPEYIATDLLCQSNNLKSLKGAPKEIGDLDCSENSLVSLEGGPDFLDTLYCGKNPNVLLDVIPKRWKEIITDGQGTMTNVNLAFDDRMNVIHKSVNEPRYLRLETSSRDRKIDLVNCFHRGFDKRIGMDKENIKYLEESPLFFVMLLKDASKKILEFLPDLSLEKLYVRYKVPIIGLDEEIEKRKINIEKLNLLRRSDIRSRFM